MGGTLARVAKKNKRTDSALLRIVSENPRVHHSIMMPDKNRILLIHPLGYSAALAGRDVSRLANLMPPLGLASIAAWLESKNRHADIIDCYARPDSDAFIIKYLREHNPSFIGLTSTTSSFPDAVRIAALAKAERPDVITVFGGPHVSALREKILHEHRAVDLVVVGEGEQPLEKLLSGHPVADIPGLVWRNEEEVCFTGFQDNPLDLDSLPFPAYDKLAGFPEAYTLPIFNYPRSPNTTCVSSRGCPYTCSYCDRSVFRRSFRYNSAGYLYAHLRHLKDRYGIRHVNFYDDQFTFNRQRVVEFCEKMISRPLGMTFNCAVRAEHIDPDLLALMKKAGCWEISLGIETGDPELLAQHRQNSDLDLLARRIREIKAAGIRTKGLLMMGLPGESETSIRRSMDYVFSLPIDDINLAKFTPFPGSPLYDNIHELGTFDEDPTKMDCMHFQFIPHGMTRERLDELFLLFYKTHFKRPGVLWNYVTMIWKSPDSYRRFFMSLGKFLAFARSNERIKE